MNLTAPAAQFTYIHTQDMTGRKIKVNIMKGFYGKFGINNEGNLEHNSLSPTFGGIYTQIVKLIYVRMCSYQA